jgi:hypothetical protein
MRLPDRKFEDKPMRLENDPLLFGIVGPSSSGKTFSAMRLAVGIQRVVGGEIFVIDTEHGRARHYAKRFKVRHIDMEQPFGPLHYLAAIEHCVERGAKTLVIDSMTHEHSGIGGVMDQSEEYLERTCGSDWKRREKMFMNSLIEPKKQRKYLNARIVQLGINAIFCYRADEKIKPVTGKEPLKLGWQPETTSKLHYDMTLRFLLTPGSGGVPSLNPETPAEKLLVKLPDQFRDFFKQGEPLSEEIGERMARWAQGDRPTFRAGPDTGQPLADAKPEQLIKYKEACTVALEKRSGAAADDMRAHIADIDAEIESRARADAATSDEPTSSTDPQSTAA